MQVALGKGSLESGPCRWPSLCGLTFCLGLVDPSRSKRYLMPLGSAEHVISMYKYMVKHFQVHYLIYSSHRLFQVGGDFISISMRKLRLREVNDLPKHLTPIE